MKIVHLNTYDGNGGAGRAVLRLNKALNDAGLQSEILTLYQFNKSSGVKTFASNFYLKLLAVFNILVERFAIRVFVKDYTVPFSLQRMGVSLKKFKLLKDADVIHIHWVNHGFLNPSTLKELSIFNHKKLFWTLHDSNPLTGGCHVRYRCEGFLNNCGHCPVLKADKEIDLSRKTWLKKNASYKSLDFQIIAPSLWMYESAKAASLTKSKKAYVIENALEMDVFQPLNQSHCRQELNLPQDAFIMLAGYMPAKADRHKGLIQMKEALKLFAEKNINHQCLLLFYGSGGEGMNLDLPIPHQFLGKINDDSYLVKLYNAADVFIFPSLEESMGYTALESLACATPVVGFKTSGVVDVVKHLETGYLATLYDTHELAEGLLWVLHHENRNSLGLKGREFAEKEFSLPAVAQKHINLYHTSKNA